MANPLALTTRTSLSCLHLLRVCTCVACVASLLEVCVGLCSRVRPWYLLALSSSNTTVVTYPYWDASGAGLVVTIARAVVPSWSAEVSAVVGMDLSVRAITAMLADRTECGLTTYSSSSYCVVIDDGGYVVWHPTTWDSSSTSAVYIGSLLPQVRPPFVLLWQPYCTGLLRRCCACPTCGCVLAVGVSVAG